MCDGSCTVGDNVSQASSRVGPGLCRIGADWKRVHHGQAGERRAASMLFLFSVVFGTLGVALGKVSTACPASCVSDGLLNGQHLVRVGTSSDSSLHTTRDSRKWGGVYSSLSGLGFPGALALRLADTLPGSCPKRAPRPPLR